MKATKYTLSVEIEVLDIDVLPGMLQTLQCNINQDITSGLLQFVDGDSVAWELEATEVIM